MPHQLTLDMAGDGECRDRRWLVLAQHPSCPRCDATADERGHCRYGWQYASGNETVLVTPLEESASRYTDTQFLEWPRAQGRTGTETGEVVVGEIEQALRLIRRRGFTAEIQAAARSARDVVRRRSEPRAVSAAQPSTVCGPVVLTALAA